MPCKKCPSCGVKLPRATRAPNAYNLFVKQSMQIDSIQALPPTQRMKAIASLWKTRST